jgi:hypothetical protein
MQQLQMLLLQLLPLPRMTVQCQSGAALALVWA